MQVGQGGCLKNTGKYFEFDSFSYVPEVQKLLVIYRYYDLIVLFSGFLKGVHKITFRFFDTF